MRNLQFLFIVPAMTTLLSACAPPPQTMTLKSDDGKTTVQATVSGTQPYPQAFPLPQFPASTVVVTTENQTAEAGTPKRTIMLSTKEPSAKIGQYYREQLASGGWKIDNDTVAGNTAVINATKGPDHLVVMLMSDNEGTTSISLSQMQ